MRSRTITFILICYLTTVASAFQPVTKFNRLGTQDGLSHDNVYAIAQDDHGFMWFGTQDGLNRFDGYHFTVHRHEPLNQNSLSASNFGKIAKDSDGSLWFGTWGGGLDHWNPSTGQFKHYRHDPGDSSSLSDDRVHCLYQDSRGCLWIGTAEGGLNRFLPQDNSFQRFLHNPADSTSLSHNRVRAIVEDSSRQLWVATYGGLNRLDPATGTFTRYDLQKNLGLDPNVNQLQTLVLSNDQTLWIGTREHGLVRFDPHTNDWKTLRSDPHQPPGLIDLRIECLWSDSDGFLWIGTYNSGLYRLDPHTGHLVNYQHDPRNITSLSHNRIEALYEDRSRVLWIATRGGGLCTFDLKAPKFFNLLHHPDQPNQLPHASVTCITQDRDGDLWIGTDGGGLVEMDHASGHFTYLQQDPANLNSISNNRVWNLQVDATNTIWAGTYQSGLNRITPTDNGYQITHYRQNDPRDFNSLIGHTVYSIYVETPQKIWVGTERGLNLMTFSDATGDVRYRHYTHDPHDPNSLGHNFVANIYPDNQHQLWIATNNGIDRFDPRSGAFNHFPPDPQNPRSVSVGHVRPIHIDRNNILWLGTEDGGLNRFDPQTAGFKHYFVEDGLANNTVVGIVEDDQGHLWITTHNGLSRFDPETETFRNYDLADGLINLGFNPEACFRDRAGNIYLGSVGGLTQFHPDHMRDNPHIPPIKITSFKTFDKEVPFAKPIWEMSEINLYYKNNFFSFDFAALDYTDPKQNQYAYQLQGFDPEWIYCGPRRYASYTNLSPGRYIFKVKGSNNDYVWNENGQALKITITKPQLHFENLSTNQGLTHGIIYSILQDQLGFMWFAGEGGLVRYDGQNFREFQHDPRDPNSISSSDLSYIYEDHRGRIWCATWGSGLSCFHPESESFTHLQQDPANPNSLSDNRVQTIYQDRRGMLWFGTFRGGLNQFDPATGLIQSYQYDAGDPYSISNNRIWSIIEDNQDRLWVATESGLNRLDRETGRFVRYQHRAGDTHSLSHNQAQWLYVDREGMLWVSTQFGLNRYDAERDAFIHYLNDPTDPLTISNNSTYVVHEDQFGNFWVGTNGGGINLFDRETETFTHFENDPGDPHSLCHNDIRTIYEDPSGILWIGTRGGGISKLHLRPQKFTHVQADPTNLNSLSDNHITAICVDSRQNLWIGTDNGGLNVYDDVNDRFIHFRQKPGAANSLSSDRIRGIMESQTGELWIATYRGGLNRFDPNSRQIRHYTKNTSLSSNRVYCTLQDHRGDIWIGTDNGLNRLDPESDTITHYYHDPADPSTLSHNSILCLLEDRDQQLWLGTWGGGLSRLSLNSSDSTFTRFEPGYGPPFSLSHDVVQVIHEDARGRLWIGTWGGLNKYDPQTEEFTAYYVTDGLPSNEICGILEDKQGRLWISTTLGLCRFNPNTETFRTFYLSDGLQSLNFTRSAYFQSPAGEMFFGGLNGFNRFWPREVRDNPSIPPIVLTDFKVFDQSYHLPTAPSFTRNIELSYRQNFFAFEFAALDFANPRQNEYAYRLEGFDKDWVYCGKRRYASYTNLDGGRYYFHVKGSNNDGVWNEAGITIQITIRPPFWETWWFQTGGILLLFILTIITYRWRVRAIRRHNERLEGLVDQRTAELKHINYELRALNQEKIEFLGIAAHDLKNPLAVIRGYAEIIQTSLADLPQETIVRLAGNIQESARRMSNLIKDLLDVNAIESNWKKLQQQPIDLGVILVAVINDFTHQAQSKSIPIQHHIPDAPAIILGDPDETYRVIGNLLSNAIKFSPQGQEIQVHLQVLQNYLQLRIIDRGPGISAEEQKQLFQKFTRLSAQPTANESSTGLGLYIVRQLVQAMNGRVWCESEPGHGAAFILQFPRVRDK